MKKWIIISAVIAGIATFFAYAGFSAASRGVGDMEMAKGEMIVEEGAKDEDFQIETDAVVLIRSVEMFQYVENDISDYSYDVGFYKKRMPNVTVKKGKNSEETYVNPKFPESPKNEIFYGKVKLGDTGLYVADEMLKKLTLGSYIDFKNEHPFNLLKDLPEEGGKSYGLQLHDGWFYTNEPDDWKREDGWTIGDIRVTYYVVPAEEGVTFTVAGDIHDNVIGEGRDKNVAFIYDYDLDKTVEEISEETDRGNFKVGVGGTITAVIFWGLAVFFFFLERKLDREYEEEQRKKEKRRR